ncbi:MAG: dockerin type I repeat-containing protein [Clostridia bacterium]|nr:dockerin type I repeat-containing protein [Clostridia bacterium]
MKQRIKILISTVLCLAMLVSVMMPALTVGATTTTTEETSGVALAPLPLTYAGPQSIRLTEDYRPDSYKVLNPGVDKEFKSGQQNHIAFNMGMNSDMSNVAENTVGLVFLLDLSEGKMNTWNSSTNKLNFGIDVWSQESGTKAWPHDLNPSLRMGLSKVDKNNANPAIDFNGVFATTRGNGSIFRDVNHFGGDKRSIFRSGESCYITIQITKAELKEIMTKCGVTDYSGAYMRLTDAGQGSDILGTTVHVYDFGLLVGDSYETACNELEAAYKTQMNYVPTNGHIYLYGKDGYGKAYQNCHTNYSSTSLVPEPVESQSRKMIYSFDNTLNNKDITFDEYLAKSYDNGGGGYYVGTLLNKVIYVDASGKVNTSTAPAYPANSYGYVLLNEPNGVSLKDANLRALYSGSLKNYTFYIGSFGYLLNPAAFETQVTAQMTVSANKISTLKNTLDTLDSADDYVAAVTKARAIYDEIANGMSWAKYNPVLQPEFNLVGAEYADKLAAAEDKMADYIAEMGMDLAPLPLTYAGKQDNRIPAEKLPESYNVLNADGIDSPTYAADGAEGTNTHIGEINLGLNSDMSNVGDDMVALVFYLDLGDGRMSQYGTAANNVVIRLRLATGEKYVEWPAISTLRLGYGKPAEKTADTSYNENRKYGAVHGTGSLFKDSNFFSVASNGWNKASFASGESYYVMIKMTKAELKAMLDAQGVTDYSKAGIVLSNGEYAWGGDMVGAKAYVRDIGVLEAENFDTADKNLEIAYKVNLNYVPTNGHIYMYGGKTGCGKFYNNCYTNYSIAGNVPPAADGQSRKLIYYFDNTLNNTALAIDNSMTSGHDNSGSGVGIASILNKIVYVDGSGEVKTSTTAAYPANSYGYVLMNEPTNVSFVDCMYSFMSNTIASKKFFVGSFGYVLDPAAFEVQLMAKMNKSAKRIADVKAKVSGIDTAEDYVAAVCEALEAYNAISSKAWNIYTPALSPESNLLTAEYAAIEAAEYAITEPVQTAIDEIAPGYITPISEAGIAAAEKGYNELPDVMKGKITNAEFIASAWEEFAEFRPESSRVHKNNNGLRFMSYFDVETSWSDYYPMVKYGATVISADLYTGGELTVDTANATLIENAMPESYLDSGELGFYYGTTVAIPEGKENVGVLVRPYIVYSDGVDDYYVYGMSDVLGDDFDELRQESSAAVSALSALSDEGATNGIIRENTSVISGDVTGEAGVNVLDFIRLKKQISDSKAQIDLAGADCNNDGYVDIDDLVIIKKFLLDVQATYEKPADLAVSGAFGA